MFVSIARRTKVWLFVGIIVSAMGLPAAPAQAALDPVTLTANLNNLVLQGNTLVATVSATVLTPGGASSQLSQLENAVAAYQQNVLAAYNTVAAATGSFSVTNDLLLSLQNLAAVNASLSAGLQALSGTVVTLGPMMYITTLKSSLATILRLSDDIGGMANRILEMADKILVMADNIGIMADRILATQVIQNTNVKLVVDAILQTQLNMILLAATL